MSRLNFIKRLDLRLDALSLKRDWRSISAKIDIVDRQISLNHTPDCTPSDRWHQGNGSLFWEHKNPGLKYSEKSFSVLNEDLQNIAPYFFTVCQKMLSLYPIGRIRLMTMEPNYTYPVHKDFERRWHIPIIAPTDSFLYFKHAQPKWAETTELDCPVHGFGVHLPDDGFVYELEASHFHTACNSGNHNESKTRVHLVFDEAVN